MGTVPARRQERPTRPLPAPELVSLIGKPGWRAHGLSDWLVGTVRRSAGHGLGGGLPPRPDASPVAFPPRGLPELRPASVGSVEARA